jgi:transglutaminase-like putative cysteine protease
MRQLEILHRTTYRFPATVRLGPHRLLLRPREGADLRIELSRLETTPKATLRWLRDEYDNAVAIASFESNASQLDISSTVIVQQYNVAPLDFLVAESAVNYPFTYDADAALMLQPYLARPSSHDEAAISAWLAKWWRRGEAIQTYALLDRLCTGINKTLTYQVREQPGVQSAAQTVQRGIGSCRDFATLLMEVARHLGLAARFVSGYLNSPPAAGSSGSTHAWAEVYIPGAGWKGFDPTIGEVAGSKNIAVAVARVADAVSPVTGTYFGPKGAELEVGVWVKELPQKSAAGV